MFGRKKKDATPAGRQDEPLAGRDAEELDADLADEETDGELTELGEEADDDLDAEGDEDTDELEDDDADDEADEDDSRDEWDELDASQDWRDDGPFDIDEVDLDDDPVNRVDFGSLIITPFEGMQLQLQVDQATQAVQTALVMHGNSGLEIALFAAPRSGGLAREVRQEMLTQAIQAGGQGELAAGPFGTEVRRIIPMVAPDGQQAAHVSRTWLAEGPRWLLRGVLMGEVALGATEDGDHEFVEFFKNLIVRRGTAAMAQGTLVPMTLPDELKPQGA